MRDGGRVSIVGDYIGFADKIPVGSLMNRILTVKTGQCPAQRYLRPLTEKMQRGEIDPSFVVTHRAGLDEAPAIYDKWNNKADGIVKAVLSP